MPTYNVKHKETGETKEFRMTIQDYCLLYTSDAADE